MKKQENRPRLVLKKETIARLNNFGMGRIYGGDDGIETVSRAINNCLTDKLITQIGATCPIKTCNC